MCDEQAIYISPLNNYKIVPCDGLWGYPKFEVGFWNGAFWESRYDGEGQLNKCFGWLCRQNVISKDEKKFQIEKWCK